MNIEIKNIKKANVTDLWLNEIGDSIIGKKSGMMDRKKKEKDPEIKL